MKNNIRKNRIYYPDLYYNSIEISKFINVIMFSGKKIVARNIVYNAFNYIFKKLKKNPLYVFSVSIDNISPMMEVKKKKKFGGIQTIFSEIRNFKRISLAMRMLKNSSRTRKEKYMYLRLGNEIIEGFERRSKISKKRGDLNKFSNSNKSYFNN
ncbi:30S ribosomal protein S7p (S5e) [Candidatus Nasuia deltocephalinicola]|nr:30S ribosomal protein S7p (S5e) [Candidatus Nasuia deltocephalinicola]